MAGMEFDSVKRQSIAQRIVDEISTTLLEKDVSPGEKLPSEQELMNQFQVSRSTIRQALHVLVSMGIVASVPGKGYYVTEGYKVLLKSNNLQKILSKDDSFFRTLEARRLVGQSVAKLAAERATAENFINMEDALEKLKAAETVEESVKAARNVHLEVAKSTNNEVLTGLLEQLLIKIEEKAKEAKLQTIAGYKQHKVLIEAIKEADLEHLEEVVYDHSEQLRKEFLSVLGAIVKNEKL